MECICLCLLSKLHKNSDERLELNTKLDDFKGGLDKFMEVGPSVAFSKNRYI